MFCSNYNFSSLCFVFFFLAKYAVLCLHNIELSKTTKCTRSWQSIRSKWKCKLSSQSVAIYTIRNSQQWVILSNIVCTILSCLKQQNAHVVDNRFAASESANSRHNLLPYVKSQHSWNWEFLCWKKISHATKPNI